MASMPHITVKVDSSQVQRLIEMADQLRRMSDDLREVIREQLTVETRPRTTQAPSTMSAAAAMHESAGTHPADYSRDDPDAIQDAP